MSCFTIAAAPALTAIFPEARFVHAVRDGRDSGSSKVSKRQKAHHPHRRLQRHRVVGGPAARSPSGACAIRPTPNGGIRAISLDELVSGDREAHLRRAPRLPRGSTTSPAMRDFFEGEMSADAAHTRSLARGPRPRAAGAPRGSLRGGAGADRARGLPLRRRSCGATSSVRARAPRADDRGLGATWSSSAAPAAPAPTSSAALLGSPLALGRRPGRGSLPLQQAGDARPARGPDHARARSSRSCAASGGTDVRVDEQPRGLYNLITHAAFDAAVERFAGELPRRPGRPPAATSSAACSGGVAEEEAKPGLVEMSSHNIREAQTLRRLFPDARFIHTVRDGRDAASSVTTKTWGPDRVAAGDRLVGRPAAGDRGRGPRASEDGPRYALPAGPPRTIVLDDLVDERPRARLRRLLGFLGSRTSQRCGTSSIARWAPSPPTWGAGRRASAASAARGSAASTSGRCRALEREGNHVAGPLISDLRERMRLSADPVRHLERHRPRPPDPGDGDRPPARRPLRAARCSRSRRPLRSSATSASRSSTSPPTDAPGAGTDWRWSRRLRGRLGR